jgi:hypothetical protein
MSHRAIYAYPWNLADEGVSAVIGSVRGLGIDTITVAGSYHAGKFLQPHGRQGKVYFPDDGTVYFRADGSRYGEIKPILSSLVRERDVLSELASNPEVATNVWMVLLHNSRLGALHPLSTVRNAFGDRYVYSLCPSAPEARQYAIALCKDVADNYAVSGITIETPGFLPYAHGYHHEFAMVPPNTWLNARLGLCFCDHCAESAGAAGIDALALQASVRTDVDNYLSGDIDFPDDMAEAFWLSDVATNGTLTRFLNWRSTVVTSLVEEIRAHVRADIRLAVIPSVARPTGGAWYEGTDLTALARAAGIIEACFYERNAGRVRADIYDTKRRMHGAGILRGIIRPGFPDLASRSDVVDAARALRDAGISEIAFYNYGHLRRSNLGWIADALAVFEDR